MLNSEEKLKDLASLLNSENNTLIEEGIRLLREDQPFRGAIGLLTRLFDKTDDSSIRRNIGQFMNDLKEQSASSEIITEIKKQWKAETITMLVSSCWQSGLDYSDYYLEITDVFLKGDYLTALECLTVIEEAAGLLKDDKKDEILSYIEKNTLPQSNEKRELTQELITILIR